MKNDDRDRPLASWSHNVVDDVIFLKPQLIGKQPVFFLPTLPTLAPSVLVVCLLWEVTSYSTAGWASIYFDVKSFCPSMTSYVYDVIARRSRFVRMRGKLRMRVLVQTSRFISKNKQRSPDSNPRPWALKRSLWETRPVWTGFKIAVRPKLLTHYYKVRCLVFDWLIFKGIYCQFNAA